MKRANNLIPFISDINNLRLAFWKASKGKRHATNVLIYQKYLEENLLLLREQILAGEVKVGNYRYFKIYEPKERQICASAFSEQVLHHALMNVCHEYFEKIQVFDSYASRKGKGTYKAIARAQMYAKKYTYFLKLDVRKFFDSIHHEVLKNQLENMFKEPILLHIFNQIIDSYTASKNRGLPIGNLTSQYFANHYLAELDHFVKENLKCDGYVRYMDDMLLFAHEKNILKDMYQAIASYLVEKLLCIFKPLTLGRVYLGIPFLGYLLYSVHIRLLQKSKKRFFRKFHKLHTSYLQGIITERVCQRKVLPLLAFVRKACTKKLRALVLENK